MFGTSGSIQVGDPAPNEIAGERYMQDAWVAFIRDPYKGLTNFGWPVYNPNSESISSGTHACETLN